MNALREMMLKVLVLIAVVCIAGCSFLYFGQESLIFHPERLPANYRYPFPGRFEELMWDVDGAKINALHFRVEHPKGAVLYFHGNAGSLRDWGDVAGEFTGRGYDIVMPDYRGYGKSTGKIKNEDMLHQDAAVAYRYLQRHYQESEIVIYGRSIGSGLAVYLARSSKPRMLILESPFFSLRDVAQYHYPFLPAGFFDRILRYPMRSDLWIPEVACPVYIIHGMKDEVVPYSSSEKLLKLIKTSGKLITIEDGGHNNLSDFKLYQEQLDQILK
jgi:pimeloyl-ACP methyl ester carboxylesterase